MADDLTIDVGVDTGSAASDLNKVASALAGVAGELREAAAAAGAYAKALGTAGANTVAAQKNAKSAASAIQAQARAVDDLAKAQRAAQASALKTQTVGGPTTGTRADIGTVNRASLEASNFAREQVVKMAQREQAAIMEVVKANIAETKAAREAGEANRSYAGDLLKVQQQQAKRYATIPKASNNVVTPDMKNLVATANGARRVGDSFGIIEQQATRAGTAVGNMDKHLFTARFALNDISFAAAGAGAALLGINTAATSAAATYETAMAAIQRTTQTSSDAMQGVRDDFLTLANTIPGGFDNLARIGELAGQLNVPANAIASFTETVAKFVSTTDVSVDTATEAFGRLDALLPDVQGNYNALGSSILNVGINSVATESSIISTTTQIAAAGAAAKLTADEVIALAASYASLGIAPEAARGSTIRIFAEIRSAVEEGGAALDEFAKIANMSAQDFSAAFRRDGADALKPFLTGLGEMARNGESAESALRELGITGVRDINALLRLSQNMDVVNKAFSDAEGGFQNGTALQEAFGITSQTLTARLEILAQTFQGLMAQMGEATAGPLKAFVDGLTNLTSFMTDLTKTGAGQFVVAFAAISSVLVAGTLVLVAITSRFGSMALAVRQTKTELLEMQAAAQGATGRMAGLKAGLTGAALSALTLRGALTAIASSTVIGLGLTALVTAWDAVASSMKSASEVAKETFGSFEDLRTALRTDAENDDTTYGRLPAQLQETTKSANDASAAINELGNFQKFAAETANEQARGAEAMGNAYGVATAKVIASMIGTSEAWKSAKKNLDELEKSGKYTGIDEQGFLTKLVKNDIAGAQAMLDAWEQDLTTQGFGYDAVGVSNANNAFKDLKTVLEATKGAFEETANSEAALQAVSDATGYSVAQLNGMLEDTEGASDTASNALQKLRDAVASAFSEQNNIIAMANDMYTLAQGIYEGGVAFDALSQAGGTNLGNLQNAVVSIITTAQAMGVSSTDAIAALFINLQRMGVDTANLLASVASVAGVSAGALNSAIANPSAITQQWAASMGAISNSAQKAAKSVGGGGGGSLGGAAKKATKEIRTLLDYAGDLRDIFSRAFDIRFSVSQGLDAITSGWRDIEKATTEALQNIREIQAEQSQLGADKASYEYFLGVAEMYNDTLRATEIRAKLADIDAEMAANQADLQKEQDKTNKSLNGNSDAAIENRKTILDMVRSYQDLIEKYAESGASQAELSAYASQLKTQFIQQATQLGYNTSELGLYAAAFDDVTVAINKVPRNITVTADTNPALQAFNEMVAKAATAGQSAGGAASRGIQQGFGSGPYIPPVIAQVQYRLPSYDALMRMQAAIRAQTGDQQFRIALGPGGQGGQVFGKGGYTGDVGVKQAAGTVHGKEFVVNAENTAKFRPILEAMNRGQLPMTPVATSAPSIQVVELSAFDRQLLAQAGNVQLSIGGRVIADATNSANFVSTTRGSN